MVLFKGKTLFDRMSCPLEAPVMEKTETGKQWSFRTQPDLRETSKELGWKEIANSTIRIPTALYRIVEVQKYLCWMTARPCRWVFIDLEPNMPERIKSQRRHQRAELHRAYLSFAVSRHVKMDKYKSTNRYHIDTSRETTKTI
jgi:hypothetical protein